MFVTDLWSRDNAIKACQVEPYLVSSRWFRQIRFFIFDIS